MGFRTITGILGRTYTSLDVYDKAEWYDRQIRGT